MYKARNALQAKEEKASEELKKLHLAHAEIQTMARADYKELQQVEQIAACKPFLLQCVFRNKGFVELTELWCFAEVFVDLLKSALDTGHHFGKREGHEADKAFWQQFQASPRPKLLNHQMK